MHSQLSQQHSKSPFGWISKWLH